MIKVFQIDLSDSELALLRREGWGASPKIVAYGKRSFVNPQDVDMQFYTHVADVEADDLEDAFRLMNLWDEPSKVTKHGSCCSMSVGDVVETTDGKRFLCASFGFKALEA